MCAGRAFSAMRAHAVGAGRRCDTVPLCVSWATSPNTAWRSKARMISIDRFFRLTGRASGTTRPSSRSIIVISSDSSRQPESISAAVSVLLPAPGSPGRMTARPWRSSTAACSSR